MTRRKTHLDPSIKWIPFGEITIVPITEQELDALEHGSPESLFLNLAIAAFSVATSFFASLLSTTIPDIRTFCVFVIVTAIGFLTGTTFSLLWWKSRRSLRKVVDDIRGRISRQEAMVAIESGGETPSD